MKKYDNLLIPEPFGLINTGAICYFNSFLQTLCSCSAFTATVLENKKYLLKTMTGKSIYNYVCKYKLRCNNTESDNTESENAESENAESENTESNNTKNTKSNNTESNNTESDNIAFSTIEVLKALKFDLKERRPKINFGHGQESAHEVFVLLLDMMEPADPETENFPLLSSINSPITKLFLHKCEWSLYCISCKKTISKKIDYGVIFDMHHIDTYTGKKNTPLDFSKLIKQHISSVEGYKCPTCSGESICRIYNLKRIPEIVFCSFNIYYHTNRQVRYFPPHLEFKTNNEDNTYIFKLISQIEHSGSLNGGHYWVKCLRDSGIYELNDMGVSPSIFQSTPYTYMVIYHVV